MQSLPLGDRCSDRVTHLGSHDELLALGGSYAALRRSWQTA